MLENKEKGNGEKNQVDELSEMRTVKIKEGNITSRNKMDKCIEKIANE